VPFAWFFSVVVDVGQFAQRIKFKFLDCLLEWQAKGSNYCEWNWGERSFCDFAHNNNLNNVPGIDDWSAMVATVLIPLMHQKKMVENVFWAYCN